MPAHANTAISWVDTSSLALVFFDVDASCISNWQTTWYALIRQWLRFGVKRVFTDVIGCCVKAVVDESTDWLLCESGRWWVNWLAVVWKRSDVIGCCVKAVVDEWTDWHYAGITLSDMATWQADSSIIIIIIISNGVSKKRRIVSNEVDSGKDADTA